VGGSFGGMMMRHAMALNGSNSYGYSERRREKTAAEKILETTEDTLAEIKHRRQYERDLAVGVFEMNLVDNAQVLYEAGLLKKGDTLYKILCRAADVPYKKPRKKK
jgi:hypothetical protein